MKNLAGILFFSLASLFCLGNAAMPGMWQTGYGARFIPLFKEDSIHFGKIQMQRELVLVNLYPGFAAVKGEYWMLNTTDQPVTIRVGYPINGRYNQELVSNVMFSDLYKLKVLVNDSNVAIQQPGTEGASLNDDKMGAKNWYYWSCTFAPKQLTKITVYFLTNNSEATLTSGYSKDKGNAFAYILETGKAWAGKIERGQILIRLNDELSLNDFKGVYPMNALSGDKKHLQFAFTNLEPDSSNNILLWYDTKTKNDFQFENITANSEQYYKDLDAFPVNEFNSTDFKLINKKDFKPHNSGLTLFWIFLAVIVIVVIAVIAGIIYLVYRLVRNKKTVS